MLSEQIGCAQTFVARIRSEVSTSANLPSRVIGRDGKSYPATRQSTAPPVETPRTATETGEAVEAFRRDPPDIFISWYRRANRSRLPAPEPPGAIVFERSAR
jgi:hypothetical protein